MAYINVDEVYVLDNTGLQVDQVVDLPYKAAGLTDAQKAQARANIGAGGSNRNLLDNWYFVGGGTSGAFPINQRGEISRTASGHFIDRWIVGNGLGTITLNSAYVSYTSGATGNVYLQQKLDTPVEGTYTLSAIVSGTGNCRLVISDSNATTIAVSPAIAINGKQLITLTATTSGTPIGMARLRVDSGAYTINWHAAKLEQGTVSTLANDAPPDYGTELAKCQRHFLRLTGSSWQIFGSGWNSSTTIADILIPTPVTMRANPTLSYTGTFSVRTNGADKAISAASSFAVQQNGVYAVFTSSGLTANQMACVVSVGGTIDLSADL